MRSMMMIVSVMMMMGSIHAHKNSPFYTDSTGKGCTAVPVDKCDAKNNCLSTFFVYDEKKTSSQFSNTNHSMHTFEKKKTHTRIHLPTLVPTNDQHFFEETILNSTRNHQSAAINPSTIVKSVVRTVPWCRKTDTHGATARNPSHPHHRTVRTRGIHILWAIWRC
jgi:hypothetical protein